MDRAGIAERLRALIGGLDSATICAVAARLGVEELSLRMSIDPDSPHPTVEVLAAAIGEYGVDPTWLLTGRYSSRTHREAVENPQRTEDVLRDHLAQPRPLVAEPTPERARLFEQN